jgi:hypothetical protein
MGPYITHDLSWKRRETVTQVDRTDPLQVRPGVGLWPEPGWTNVQSGGKSGQPFSAVRSQARTFQVFSLCLWKRNGTAEWLWL